MNKNKVSKNLGGAVTDFFFWGGGGPPPKKKNGPAGNPAAIGLLSAAHGGRKDKSRSSSARASTEFA